MSEPKRSAATKLVEIAEELFVFGCVSEQRDIHNSADRVAVHTWASPKGNPEVKRALVDIRGDLAEVYAATHGSVPGATALGDAMTVLEARARKAEPDAADDGGATLASILAGGKDSVSTVLVQMARERFRLGVTTTGEAFAVPVDGPNVARVLRGGRRSLRAELARLYYEKTKAAANAQALADALLVIEGEAQTKPPTEVALRVGRARNGELVLDLGREDGAAVVIGPYGWDVVEHSPVLFWRTNATLPLPDPDQDGGLRALRELLNVADTDWPLIVAWLVAALIADMPHPVLLLRGEHGTAKSSAARLVTSLIDRCASQLRTAPRNVEDWAVAATGSWVTCLDNISDVQPWLSDAICRAVTGDGMLRRQLYTDSDISVLAFRRVVALTSVDPGRLHGDLADRMVTVELERIPDAARVTEETLNAKWLDLHASVLGGLLHVTVEVLRALPKVTLDTMPRMADFARVLAAVDLALGTAGYASYVEQASKTAETVAEGDSVVIAIRERIAAAWSGTAGELLKLLTPDKPPKDWPANPQGMGGRLVRAAPTLRSLGWTVERRRAPKTGTRVWTLDPPAGGGTDESGRENGGPAEEYPAGSSPLSPLSPRPPDQHEPGDDRGDEFLWGDDHPGWGDEQGDDPDRDVSAGGDGGDNPDNLAGVSSELAPSSSSPACARCGQRLLVTAPGRTLCERCRLDDTAAGTPP